jgi:hypothetical protein
MAQTILIKRSSSTATPTSLANGELAYSSNSNKLFIGNPGGAVGDVYAVGGKYYTDIIAGAASANTASKLVVRDGSGNFSAGTITATLTGNVTGALTGNADTATVLATARTIGGVSFNGSANINLPGVNSAGNQDTSGVAASATVLATARTIGGTSFNGSADIAVALAATATKWATARTASITGDLTWTSGNFDGTANVTAAGTLATVNSTVGAFGSTTAVPIVTVNAKGLVTSVTTAAIATSFNVAADTGTTDAIAGGETLTVSGGTGVSSVVSANEVTLAIGQAVATTSNVTFNNVSVDGTLTSDDITAANMTASGNVIVTGDLTVNGTTTTVNSTAVALGDNIITLNSGETGTPSANAGLEVERGTSVNASILWNETGNYWQTTDGETANVTSQILTAANFAATYTGNLDGGTF